MKLLLVNFNTKDLVKTIKNSVSYSKGFLDGVNMQSINFNQQLAEFTVDVLNKYIDARARSNPAALHHVYEWDRVGNSSARLFEMDSSVSKNKISFTGKFLPSKSISPNSSEPFTDKANVMENGIAITIEPRNSDVLAFEADGELVFTRNSIYIEHPGGDEVAGSFGEVVDDFFTSYFTNAFLEPFFRELSTPTEYSKSFAAGSRSGASVGVKAGKKYLTLPGGTIE